eukprot:m.46562 g.46562  ORF g.46562 m.46562 type:complete len:71 (-) comp10932_c0_seq1:103-315(-)
MRKSTCVAFGTFAAAEVLTEHLLRLKDTAHVDCDHPSLNLIANKAKWIEEAALRIQGPWKDSLLDVSFCT